MAESCSQELGERPFAAGEPRHLNLTVFLASSSLRPRIVLRRTNKIKVKKIYICDRLPLKWIDSPGQMTFIGQRQLGKPRLHRPHRRRSRAASLGRHRTRNDAAAQNQTDMRGAQVRRRRKTIWKMEQNSFKGEEVGLTFCLLVPTYA